MSKSSHNTSVFLILIALSLLIFIQGIGVHGLEFRDDEIFYYRSTQEMMATGDLLSPTYFGHDRFQKPILFYWLIILSYKIFGTGWPAARMVACVFAALSVALTWRIARDLFNDKVATMSAVILITIPLFFRHAKNAVPDMPLNFFIVLAIYWLCRFTQKSSGKYATLFFISCAVGFMIKGFAAIIIPFLSILIFLPLSGRKEILKQMRFGRGLGLMALIILPWFCYMVYRHGFSYLEYMVINETKDRLLGSTAVTVNQGPVWLVALKQIGGFLRVKVVNYFGHLMFYFQNIFSYFAPWSAFLIGAVPLALSRVKRNKKVDPGLMLMLVWFCVVLLFFSSMYFVINHYMLVLTTPFAVLVAFFLMEPFAQKKRWAGAVRFSRKYFLLFVFSVGVLGFGFLLVFLAGGHPAWLILLGVLYAALTGWIIKSADPAVAPMTLGIFIAFVFSQSALLGRAGLTAHATLQNFAVAIKKDQSNKYVIGVGSHDIHEKEFQVYFDRAVKKAAASDDDVTRVKLEELFADRQKVYCLITEKDFHSFLNGDEFADLKIVKEDYIFRRRMSIDRGFFTALLTLDQKKVHDYLMEKLILIEKEENARI